ncbi:MAG: 30S ribosomal protein S8 [Promethearchaeota archaeon]|nr:MAG: 30S ribosomal protein S8 [Candidatus Lokiarchaeota archaeon]
MTNTLADMCNTLKMGEYAKKKEVIITPASKLNQHILRIFQRHAYINKF